MEKQYPILIAEDDPSEAFLIERAIRKGGFNNPFYICSDGEQTQNYMRGTGQYSDRTRFPFPRVLLIDLKMPRMGGFELLAWLQKHPDCSVIPTVILTSSAIPTDVQRAYELGANAYLVKPLQFEEMARMFRVTLEFWQLSEKPACPSKCS